jgi:hypothetical protein
MRDNARTVPSDGLACNSLQSVGFASEPSRFGLARQLQERASAVKNVNCGRTLAALPAPEVSAMDNQNRDRDQQQQQGQSNPKQGGGSQPGTSQPGGSQPGGSTERGRDWNQDEPQQGNQQRQGNQNQPGGSKPQGNQDTQGRGSR